jgi:hypothetical protein
MAVNMCTPGRAADAGQELADKAWFPGFIQAMNHHG